VFRRYLTQGNPGYVPHEWARLGDAVRWIVDSGGMAVIAHPARYRVHANEEYALFSEFIAHGGRGVEVVTGSHSQADQARYANTAVEFGLLASRGSDFHSPGESRTELGALPDLPGTSDARVASLDTPRAAPDGRDLVRINPKSAIVEG
jgi:predicted metal-dependent phosphoesterase TrpH